MESFLELYRPCCIWVPKKKKTHTVWNGIRISKWWQTLCVWVNCPFNCQNYKILLSLKNYSVRTSSLLNGKQIFLYSLIDIYCTCWLLMIPEFFFDVGSMKCYFMASIFWHVHILYLQSLIAWFLFTMLHLNLLVMWTSLWARLNLEADHKIKEPCLTLHGRFSGRCFRFNMFCYGKQ